MRLIGHLKIENPSLTSSLILKRLEYKSKIKFHWIFGKKFQKCENSDPGRFPPSGDIFKACRSALWRESEQPRTAPNSWWKIRKIDRHTKKFFENFLRFLGGFRYVQYEPVMSDCECLDGFSGERHATDCAQLDTVPKVEKSKNKIYKKIGQSAKAWSAIF